jgi:hypothetical protein
MLFYSFCLFISFKNTSKIKVLLPKNAAGVAEYFKNNYIHKRIRQIRNRSIYTSYTIIIFTRNMIYK